MLALNIAQSGLRIPNALCAIFNASIQQGYYPSVWKMADAISVPNVHSPSSVQSDNMVCISMDH